nr:MAG TPA: hypothetical protein [Caudoviricetes sp.]
MLHSCYILLQNSYFFSTRKNFYYFVFICFAMIYEQIVTL